MTLHECVFKSGAQGRHMKRVCSAEGMSGEQRTTKAHGSTRRTVHTLSNYTCSLLLFSRRCSIQCKMWNLFTALSK